MQHWLKMDVNKTKHVQHLTTDLRKYANKMIQTKTLLQK